MSRSAALLGSLRSPRRAAEPQSGHFTCSENRTFYLLPTDDWIKMVCVGMFRRFSPCWGGPAPRTTARASRRPTTSTAVEGPLPSCRTASSCSSNTPHRIRGLESEVAWEIHLARLDGWQPVQGALVALLLHGPRGAHERTVVEPRAPGIYTAAPNLPAAGLWRAEFTVSAEGREYAIDAGPFEVFTSEEDVHTHAGHAHGNEPDAHAGHTHTEDASAAGLITPSKVEQWSFPFAVAVAEEPEIPPSIPAAGELVAPPGGLVHVSAPVAGLVQVDGPSLGPGDHVRTGRTLALIAPVSVDNSFRTHARERVGSRTRGREGGAPLRGRRHPGASA